MRLGRLKIAFSVKEVKSKNLNAIHTKKKTKKIRNKK